MTNRTAHIQNHLDENLIFDIMEQFLNFGDLFVLLES